MKKKILHDYVTELFHSMEHNLLSYNKDNEAEQLHRLRVSIKKLRALFSFASYIYNRQYKAALLKPLFKEAGIIRELQINKQILKAFPHPPQRLISELEDKENILRQQFVQNELLHLEMINQTHKMVDFPKAQASKKIVKRYFEKEQEKANKELKNRDRESLHQYRMSLKKIMYVYDALPEKLQQKIKIDKAAIDRQQEDLGDWHDTFAAIHFLSPLSLPKKSADSLLKLKETEEKQFLNFFKD
jgi:CHAD domain-containing protein